MNQDGKSATLTAPNGALHATWMRGAGCVVGGEETTCETRGDTMSIPANLLSSLPNHMFDWYIYCMSIVHWYYPSYTPADQGPSQEDLLVMALREAHLAASALNALECRILRWDRV